MISLFPLALGQLLDCQLDIATQLPGKPHGLTSLPVSGSPLINSV